jgi:hypothetical protein
VRGMVTVEGMGIQALTTSQPEFSHNWVARSTSTNRDLAEVSLGPPANLRDFQEKLHSSRRLPSLAWQAGSVIPHSASVFL